MDAITMFASAAVACMMGYLFGTSIGDAFANNVLETAHQAVERCNEAIDNYNEMIDKYNVLVDKYERLASDYKRLFDAYDEAYRILEDHGLIGGDGDETLSGDDGAEEDA